MVYKSFNITLLAGLLKYCIAIIQQNNAISNFWGWVHFQSHINKHKIIIAHELLVSHFIRWGYSPYRDFVDFWYWYAHLKDTKQANLPCFRKTFSQATTLLYFYGESLQSTKHSFTFGNKICMFGRKLLSITNVTQECDIIFLIDAI